VLSGDLADTGPLTGSRGTYTQSRVAWKIYAVGRTLTDFWSGAAFKCANSRVASRCLRCYHAGLP
jgi:hypothetical protein